MSVTAAAAAAAAAEIASPARASASGTRAARRRRRRRPRPAPRSGAWLKRIPTCISWCGPLLLLLLPAPCCSLALCPSAACCRLPSAALRGASPCLPLRAAAAPITMGAFPPAPHPLPARPQVAAQRQTKLRFFSPFGKDSKRDYTLLAPTDAAWNETFGERQCPGLHAVRGMGWCGLPDCCRLGGERPVCRCCCRFAHHRHARPQAAAGPGLLCCPLSLAPPGRRCRRRRSKVPPPPPPRPSLRPRRRRRRRRARGPAARLCGAAAVPPDSLGRLLGCRAGQALRCSDRAGPLSWQGHGS